MSRVKEATRLLQTKVDEKWTIKKLSQAVGLNEKKLKTGFRALNGSTIQKYLEDVRLDIAAAQMLADGTKVIDVTHSVGYSSPSHFAKTFHRAYGRGRKIGNTAHAEKTRTDASRELTVDSLC